MGQLTTHVLDISAGSPAAGVAIEVWETASDRPNLLASVSTGTDGRAPGTLMSGSDFRTGRYTLTFHIAEYFRRRGVVLPAPAFIEDAVIQLGIADSAQHYHVPLLISPWSYCVYRGG
jgi:5-hydroxyisourate hydrolase